MCPFYSWEGLKAYEGADCVQNENSWIKGGVSYVIIHSAWENKGQVKLRQEYLRPSLFTVTTFEWIMHKKIELGIKKWSIWKYH